MNNLPIAMTGEPEVDAFVTAYKAVLEEEIQKRVRADPVLRGLKSGGNWYMWQMDKIRHFQPLPAKRYDRFCQFLAETAPPVKEGWYHLHAFYDRQAGETYWKLLHLQQCSSICHQPGRCRVVSLVPW